MRFWELRRVGRLDIMCRFVFVFMIDWIDWKAPCKKRGFLFTIINHTLAFMRITVILTLALIGFVVCVPEKSIQAKEDVCIVDSQGISDSPVFTVNMNYSDNYILEQSGEVIPEVVVSEKAESVFVLPVETNPPEKTKYITPYRQKLRCS